MKSIMRQESYTCASNRLDELIKAWRAADDFEKQQFVVTCSGDLMETIEACTRMMKLPIEGGS